MTALAPGECAFAYITGVSIMPSPDVPPTPIIFGAVIPGTRQVDPKSNGGTGVILMNDLSVRTRDLDAAGNIILNGRNLLDPRQPFWNGKKPEVKWPE